MSDASMNIRLEPGPGPMLYLVAGDRRTRVHARRCFPWRAGGRYISLADDDGKEQCLIADPAELDPASREALAAALRVAGFTLAIHRILSIEKEIEIRNWRVAVDGGERTFQTELDEWPRELPDGTLIVRDVSGDLYSIPRSETLDEESRRLLWSLT